MNNFSRKSLPRRDFLRLTGGAAGMAAASNFALMGGAWANRHPHPNPGSVDFLDRNTYVENMQVHSHFLPPGAEAANGLWNTGGKAQMMAIGKKRFMFQRGRVYDVTDPLKPELYNDDAFIGGQLQLAYNKDIGKWILMTGASAPSTSARADSPGGKYEYPEKIERAINHKGLRGVRFYDASDPSDIKLLSKWSCDQGDPDREVQTGGGTHRNYYAGGKYAYLDTAPDNSFTNLESPWRYYSNCIQTIDASDPEKPKFLSNWWVPGQREDEDEAYRNWRYYGDKTSFTCFHGPIYVPTPVERGGKYGYSSYGHFGVFIHDVSDPANLKLVGKFDPIALPGAIAFHTVDPTRIDRGFVVGSPEPLNPDCNEYYQPTWVVDVSDVTDPRGIGKFPIPQPPETAPYEDYCNKRGRFGPHNPPHAKAPGKVHPNFTCYSYFNAGVQCFDLTRPDAPKNTAYFVPPQGGSLDLFASFDRDTDNVFVEWDRRIIWALTSTGLYALSAPALGEPVLKPMAVSEWTLPGLNEGHDG